MKERTRKQLINKIWSLNFIWENCYVLRVYLVLKHKRARIILLQWQCNFSLNLLIWNSDLHGGTPLKVSSIAIAIKTLLSLTTITRTPPRSVLSMNMKFRLFVWNVKMSFISIVFVVLLATSQSSGNMKLWQQSVTLGQADLWESGRLPCQGQSIILPSEVISLPGNFSFGSKVFLPDNGILLFPQKGKKKHLALLQCVSRIWTSLTWLDFAMVVWLNAWANFHYCPSCLKNDVWFDLICLLT